jgi:RNA-directed DNA polymerase
MEMKVNLNLAWIHVNWKKVNQSVFNLQRKIFYYSKLDDIKKVHRYQLLLVNSFKSKLLAVRQVTQDNKGKKIAGVDGIKSILPKQRWKLAQCLKLDNIAMPITYL